VSFQRAANPFFFSLEELLLSSYYVGECLSSSALYDSCSLPVFSSLFKLQKTKQLDKPKTAAAFTRWERLLTLKLSKLKKLWKYLKKKHCGAEKIEKDQVIIPH